MSAIIQKTKVFGHEPGAEDVRPAVGLFFSPDRATCLMVQKLSVSDNGEVGHVIYETATVLRMRASAACRALFTVCVSRYRGQRYLQ